MAAKSGPVRDVLHDRSVPGADLLVTLMSFPSIVEAPPTIEGKDVLATGKCQLTSASLVSASTVIITTQQGQIISGAEALAVP